MNLNARQVSICVDFETISNSICCISATEYVETCQPTYGGNVLLATYGEDELDGGADCQTIPVNNCRNVAKPNCRKIADEQCRKVVTKTDSN